MLEGITALISCLGESAIDNDFGFLPLFSPFFLFFDPTTKFINLFPQLCVLEQEDKSLVKKGALPGVFS